MNWKVSVVIYGHGSATRVEIANISKQGLEIAKKAYDTLFNSDKADEYDNSKEGKDFEKDIYKPLRYYINESRWKSLLDANFYVEGNIIVFDTGY